MVYLLRHGEIDIDANGIFIGQLDIPLSTKGKLQAGKWSEYFNDNGISFDEIYSSDLSRCQETSEILSGKSRNITYLQQFREIDLGEWDGTPRKEIKERYPDEWALRGKDITHRPPGGESFHDLSERSIPALVNILNQKASNSIIITHAGIIRSAICHILEIPLSNLFRIGYDYSGLTLIDNSNEPFKISYMNRIL